MSKIAVVGATGGLGQRLVSQALAAGYAVTAAVRDGGKAASLFGPSVSVAVVDIASGEGLPAAFAGQDVVVEVISNSERPHGIGTRPWPARPPSPACICKCV